MRQFYYRCFSAWLRAIRCHQAAMSAASRRLWACLDRWGSYHHRNLRWVFQTRMWQRHLCILSHALPALFPETCWPVFVYSPSCKLMADKNGHSATLNKDIWTTQWSCSGNWYISTACLYTHQRQKRPLFSNRGWFWILRR